MFGQNVQTLQNLAAIATAAIDVVGVYTQNYSQVFSNARPMKATIKPSAKVMEHPLENGSTIIDHRIINPIEIELSLVLQARDYKDTYQQIKQIFNNGTLLTVQTRADVYQNQIITDFPHEEDPETYDALIMSMKLREVQFANAQFGTVVPSDPKNSSTVNRGNIQTGAASAQESSGASILYGLFN